MHVYAFIYRYTRVRGKAAKRPAQAATNTAVAVPPPPALPPSNLPAGWQEAQDPTTGVTYYFNAATGESQWTQPVKV